MENFNGFKLPSFLIDILEKLSITVPTPIQASAIPLAMEGHDILASAQTGTGKTIAYLLPILPQLLEDSNKRALILAPTRELAIQVKDMLMKLIGSGKNQLNIALLIGGDPMFKQFNALKKSPQIIIGTPGRIIDHLERRSLKLNETEFLVLDETDRMLDMGFSEPLKMIIKHLPAKRQTMMFSATLPPYIIKLSQEYLNNPKHITIGSKTQPIAKIKQETIHAKTVEKYDHLIEALEKREGSIIVFVKTRIGAERLASKLKKEDHLADAIHGDLRQRQREKVILSFRNKRSRILVATDVAARGLDIPHVMHVINYDIPQCPEDYIHRIGRTGRAGAEGNALSFIAPEDVRYWRMITRLMESKDGDSGHTGQRPSHGGSKKSFGNKNFSDRKSGFRSSKPKGKFGSENRKKSFHNDEGFGFKKFERSEKREKGFNSEESEFSTEKPKKAFNKFEKSERKERSFNSDRSEFTERPKKSFGFKNFEKSERKERSFNSDRSEFTERPKKSFGFKNFEKSERPKKSFNSDQSEFNTERPKKSFGFKNFEKSERPKKSFNSERSEFSSEKPKKSFRPKFWGDKFKSGDSPRKSKPGFGTKKPKNSFGFKKRPASFSGGRKKTVGL